MAKRFETPREIVARNERHARIDTLHPGGAALPAVSLETADQRLARYRHELIEKALGDPRALPPSLRELAVQIIALQT